MDGWGMDRIGLNWIVDDSADMLLFCVTMNEMMLVRFSILLTHRK